MQRSTALGISTEKKTSPTLLYPLSPFCCLLHLVKHAVLVDFWIVVRPPDSQAGPGAPSDVVVAERVGVAEQDES